MKKVDKPKRKIGRPKGSRPAERALTSFKIQEIINLSESVLIRVLKGETQLPFNTVATVALELYKRRVPAKVEADSSGNKLTVIKIVKNHVPVLDPKDTIDVTMDNIEEATDAFIEKAKEKQN